MNLRITLILLSENISIIVRAVVQKMNHQLRIGSVFYVLYSLDLIEQYIDYTFCYWCHSMQFDISVKMI